MAYFIQHILKGFMKVRKNASNQHLISTLTSFSPSGGMQKMLYGIIESLNHFKCNVTLSDFYLSGGRIGQKNNIYRNLRR